MAERPRITEEDLGRWAPLLPSKDAARLRAYVSHHEGRDRAWFADVLGRLGSDLRNLSDLADKAEQQGRINGARIDKLQKAIEGYLPGVEVILTKHQAAAMEQLHDLHVAATRVMDAEGARLELENEAKRVEIGARKLEIERDHGGRLETRALVVEVARRAPWAVFVGAASMLAGGASLAEVLHIIAAGLGWGGPE